MDSSEAVEVDVCMYVCFFFPVWANKHDHRRQEHPCLRMASSLRADGDGGTTAGVVLPLTLVGSGIYDAYVMSCPRNLTRLRLSLHFVVPTQSPSASVTSCFPCRSTPDHQTW